MRRLLIHKITVVGALILASLLWVGASAQRGPLLLLRPGSWTLAAPSELGSANIFPVTSYGAIGDSSTDDTGSISSAFTACSAAHGGIVYFPPTGHAYRIAGVITEPAGCIARGASHGHWNPSNPIFDNVESDYTGVGSWIKCDSLASIVSQCLVASEGGGFEHLNFWQTQTTPTVTTQCSAPCTFTNNWTPNSYPFVITVPNTANHVRLLDLSFVNATNCIDVEGPTSGIAGVGLSLEHMILGCANTGIKWRYVDNTVYVNDLHHELWWYQGSSDWWGYLEGSGNHVDWDVCYLANPMINNVEFAFTGLAMKFTDCSVTSGFGTITFAANAIQATNISFNEVCQAMQVASTTTHVTGFFANTILYTDSTTSPVSGQCANHSGATNALNFALQLNSDGAVLWFTGLNVGYVQGLALVGGGGGGAVHGQLHLTQVIVQNYDAYQNSTPLLSTDSTGSIIDAVLAGAGTSDDVFSQAGSPGKKCSGTCTQKVPYLDIAANLPNCGNANPGAEVYITDLASAPSYLATLSTASGGGSNRAIALCTPGSSITNGVWQAH